MSNRYKGGVISATPPTTTGGESGTASGAWTLEQQMQLQAAGLWPAQPTGPYIEDLFSTYLYTGNGSTQTITNGIDLSTKGGLVWYKDRTTAYEHQLVDTVRGAGYNLETPNTSAQASRPTALTAFNTTGFTLGSNAAANGSGDNFVSWTFREQPKFFDVVTYTGNGTSGRTVAHNLGSVPGCIIVKRTSGDPIEWAVYHRSLDATSPQNYYLRLNTTAARALQSGNWNDTAPTSTVFTLGDSGAVNTNGETYVAYVFAHDAGGFGLTGTDNVISCGTFTGNTTVNLGFEPQWILLKNSGAVENWYIHDTMRGWPVSGDAKVLYPNLSSAEGDTSQIYPNATGFSTLIGGATYIYIAIRKGPMKVPTVGTSVFSTVLNTGNGTAGTVLTAGFPVDLVLGTIRTPDYSFVCDMDRLRGATKLIQTGTDSAETTDAQGITSFANQTGVVVGTGINNSWPNQSPWTYVNWMFRRAPSFFDEVCYTGNGTTQNVSHNLGVAPELMIVKGRNSAGYDWQTYASPLGNTSRLLLNSTGALASGQPTWNSTTPTATQFSLGSNSVNNSGTTFVAYLFATCAGVSKVGSYTGTGALQTINCGFAAGARFVFIKRTDSTGDWYVYDSSRGMTSGNDPYLFLNTVIAEVTNTNYVDTTAVGFQVTAAAPAGLNASGGTYIFLAIA